MAENVVYVNWNLPEPSRPRILTVPDGQGKSCCSRKRVAVLAVIILVLVLAVYLIITYGPTAGSQNGSTAVTSSSQNDSNPLSPPNQEDSRTLSPTKLNDSTPLSPTSQQDSTKLPPSHGKTPGCPSEWKKHERKCYFFSPERKKKSWKSSRAECTAMGSDLVIIESREELTYLLSQSGGSYYLLGLRYSPEEQKWKWINNVEHDPAMFSVMGNYSDYHCTTIGHGEIETAPCSGTRTTQNMCEKSATISRRHQES
ncbi:C-type lectin domain family 5 member A-like [Oenanthe melanoleuca]|uniref:C-type lectin domain family 5 member A-like n=1 Tax=Oenanthe melanoleuca TaxID=2939378 RepID=UPI0024C158D7|nr:C-type lectin domain family 5 member A-like [Oenanthe melanoleuca]